MSSSSQWGHGVSADALSRKFHIFHVEEGRATVRAAREHLVSCGKARHVEDTVFL
jgi:hypothetical protein